MVALVNGKKYKLTIKTLFGNGTYEIIREYDSIHDGFDLGYGAIIKSTNERIISIEVV